MKYLIMLVGLPCSGKTTWINNFITLNDKKMENTVILSTDDIFEEIAKEHDWTYNEAFKNVDFKEVQKVFDDRLKNASDAKIIIWDQTNLNAKTRKNKLKKVPNDFVKIAVCCEEEYDTILERNNIRSKETGKFIPVHVLENMKKSFQVPYEEEGFDKVYNSDTFDIL